MARIGITIVARAKHQALFAAAKKLGGVAALAEAIGVQKFKVYDWVGLKAAPPLCPTPYWTQEKLDALEKKLIELTGQTMEQLFPDELREREWLNASKVREIHKDVDVRGLQFFGVDSYLLPAPEDALIEENVSSEIEKALKKLSYREREIIKLRFGLGEGGYTYTLEEVSHIFKVNRERVRQIEARAIRKLQEGKYAHFFNLVPDSWTEPKPDFSKYDNKPEVSLKERYESHEAAG